MRLRWSIRLTRQGVDSRLGLCSPVRRLGAEAFRRLQDVQPGSRRRLHEEASLTRHRRAPEIASAAVLAKACDSGVFGFQRAGCYRSLLGQDAGEGRARERPASATLLVGACPAFTDQMRPVIAAFVDANVTSWPRRTRYASQACRIARVEQEAQSLRRRTSHRRNKHPRTRRLRAQQHCTFGKAACCISAALGVTATIEPAKGLPARSDASSSQRNRAGGRQRISRRSVQTARTVIMAASTERARIGEAQTLRASRGVGRRRQPLRTWRWTSSSDNDEALVHARQCATG